MNASIKSYTIWSIGLSFLLFQFFLQLTSGVILTSLTSEIRLSSFQIGILASAFYYIYSALQMPVGVLFDRFNARLLLALTAFSCGFGCFLFASSHEFYAFFLGRFLMGAGSAFAFIGLTHLIRTYFPIKQFSYLMGLSETFGFLATIIGMIGMSYFIGIVGWRLFIYAASIVGILISFLCWIFIPDLKPKKPSLGFKEQISGILKNKTCWINGFFVGLVFMIVTVFGALWSVPFVKLKMNCSLHEATLVTALLLMGSGLGCLLFGKLAVHLERRKPLMHFSCLSTLVLLLIVIYSPISNMYLLGLLMFLTGLCCGSYLLSYTIAIEICDIESASTSTGFTNTLAMVTAPMIQPLIGYILDVTKSGVNPDLEDYQLALIIIPLAVLIAEGLIWFLPEKLKTIEDRP